MYEKLPPTLPPIEALPDWAVDLVDMTLSLRARVDRLSEENRTLREENRALRDEVARLKKHKTKPSIRPSRLMEKGSKKRKRRGKRKSGAPRVDETVKVKLDQVPEGSQFKGYAAFTVQHLVIQVRRTRYLREKWLTPEGQVLTAPLPAEAAAGHFTAGFRAFVLDQYYQGQVTEPLLLEQLREFGAEISAAQLHRLLTEGQEQFHREKEEILPVGLRVSKVVHADDTGARHRGKNGYTTHIGNEWFASFETTDSKSRINFLELLRGAHTDYVLSDEALEYMRAQKLPQAPLATLAAARGQVFADREAWEKALKAWEITAEKHARTATEGALIGAVLSHGVPPDLVIVSDDAGQFDVLRHALCWIHAERLLAKLVSYDRDQQRDLDKVRTAVWKLYKDLQAYRTEPTRKARRALEKRFDKLCATKTSFIALNHALERMHRNKAELLLVLKRPEVPLHNNLSEGDIREYVKRRKLSGGTRSDDGRRCRDTFASLKKTCRKLGISFWSYLNDRLCNAGQIPPLPTLIELRAQSP